MVKKREWQVDYNFDGYDQLSKAYPTKEQALNEGRNFVSMAGGWINKVVPAVDRKMLTAQVKKDSVQLEGEFAGKKIIQHLLVDSAGKDIVFFTLAKSNSTGEPSVDEKLFSGDILLVIHDGYKEELCQSNPYTGEEGPLNKLKPLEVKYASDRLVELFQMEKELNDPVVVKKLMQFTGSYEDGRSSLTADEFNRLSFNEKRDYYDDYYRLERKLKDPDMIKSLSRFSGLEEKAFKQLSFEEKNRVLRNYEEVGPLGEKENKIKNNNNLTL